MTTHDDDTVGELKELFVLGAEWNHADKARWHHRAGVLSLTALPGVLFPHVHGHRLVWCPARPRLPARLPRLLWYVPYIGCFKKYPLQSVGDNSSAV